MLLGHFHHSAKNPGDSPDTPIITNQVWVWVKCPRKDLHICQSDSWPCMLLWSRSTNTTGFNQGVYSPLQQYEYIIISGNYLLIWSLLQAADVFRPTYFQYCIVIYRMFWPNCGSRRWSGSDAIQSTPHLFSALTQLHACSESNSSCSVGNAAGYWKLDQCISIQPLLIGYLTSVESWIKFRHIPYQYYYNKPVHSLRIYQSENPATRVHASSEGRTTETIGLIKTALSSKHT